MPCEEWIWYEDVECEMLRRLRKRQRRIADPVEPVAPSRAFVGIFEWKVSGDDVVRGAYLDGRTVKSTCVQKRITCF